MLSIERMHYLSVEFAAFFSLLSKRNAHGVHLSVREEYGIVADTYNIRWFFSVYIRLNFERNGDGCGLEKRITGKYFEFKWSPLLKLALFETLS